jgi:ATP-dependent helicase/nuclease subunit A
MIMQGMADLAVFLPREIWLVDFKTDEIDPLELDGRVKTYERQLRLYALALEKIYRRPITRAYLHFLTLRQSVPVPVELGANP